LEALASRMAPSADLSDHETYRAKLRVAHGRKTGFWSLVSRP
jgi:hypothetical protein